MKKLVILAALVLLMVLTVSCQALGIGGNLQSVVIPTNGTAYVASDVSSEDDPEGLRDQNFSTQDFIKVWYINKVQATEQVISVGLMKFDLSALKGKEIKSATLQMYATRTDFAKAIRLVDISVVDGTWEPGLVTYNSKPTWSGSAIATAAVYGAGVWYSWDVSNSVIQKAETGEISYVTGLNAMDDKTEEQVLFASQQAGDTAPRLLVTYTSNNSSFLPWWMWLIIVVVVAVIVFIIVWSVMRRRVRVIPPPPPAEMPRR